MESTATGHRPRVVVVDDEATEANMLAIVLSQNGFAAIALYSGSSALQLCQMASPDLAIIDIMMPSMDGIDTARQLRNLRPGCPVLLCTGAPDTQEFLAKMHDQGESFEIMSKPLIPEEVVAKARHCAR